MMTSTSNTLRDKYRPSQVKVLFVGESAPAGGTFFYAENSLLYRATRDAFVAAFPAIRERHFLSAFRDLGCYLDDLCSRPVDHLDEVHREQERIGNLPAFTERLRSMSPLAVVVVMRAIKPYITQALRDTGKKVALHDLPFPIGANYESYVKGLKRLIISFREGGIVGRVS